MASTKAHGPVKGNRKKGCGIPRLCWLGRRTSIFPEGFCGCCVRTLSMRDECSLKDVLRTIAGILPGVEMELPTPSICAAWRLERGAEGLPTAQVEGLRGRHHGRHGRQNEELAGIAEKVMKGIKNEDRKSKAEIVNPRRTERREREQWSPRAATLKRTLRTAVKKEWRCPQTWTCWESTAEREPSSWRRKKKRGGQTFAHQEEQCLPGKAC